MKGLVVGILLVLSAPACAQDSVTVREASKDKFVATLLAQAELKVEDAQRRLLPAAADTCRNSSPRFGRYEFKFNKNISSAPSTPEPFEFNQEFTCAVGAEAITDPVAPTVISESDKERLVKLVTDETRKFLGSTAGDMLGTFHSKFSNQLSTMLPREEWIKEQESLHKSSGAIHADPLLKVTSYLDPPNSPGPGIYLAVDFQASYERAPFRCGYLMWLFDQQSNLSVLRMEDGILYEKDTTSMTAEQLAQTKATFRCFAP